MDFSAFPCFFPITKHQQELGQVSFQVVASKQTGVLSGTHGPDIIHANNKQNPQIGTESFTSHLLQNRTQTRPPKELLTGIMQQ